MSQKGIQEETALDDRQLPSYVLVTPAHNEEDFIEQTLESVVSQTVHPVRWIVVSDGSTDGTDRIVEGYAQRHEWIELLRMPEHRDRHFAAKVTAFNAGYERLKGIGYDIVGNLDADISFGPDYFVFLLGKLKEDPKLGVVGTPFTESGRTYDFRYANLEHVSGACQLFRRECFEEVGGYIPIKGGAIDWAAVTMARMKGWKTRTFTERTCVHHRPIGTGGGGQLSAQFRQGRKDYYVGGHPLWQLLRSLFSMRRRPFVIGGVLLMSGYLWAFITREKSPLSREVKNFHRREQKMRLRALLKHRGKRIGSTSP